MPLRNGTEIPSKPPLFHWLGAPLSKALGRVDELSIRLPSALLGTLGVLLTYLTGVRFWGEEAGVTAALVPATSFEWWRLFSFSSLSTKKEQGGGEKPSSLLCF